jgi:hypothetical protein
MLFFLRFVSIIHFVFQAMIADQAKLKNVEFDGYLKHFKPSQRYVEERQKLFAQSLLKRFPQAVTPKLVAAAAGGAAANKKTS